MKSINVKLWGAMVKKSLIPLFFVVLITIFYNWAYQNYLKYILSEGPNKFIEGALYVLITVSVIYWVQQILSAALNWYRENIAIKTRTSLDDEFIPLFNKVGLVLLWVIGFIIILSHFGVNINALIATLGVSSLAIALAAQDTIANIISGFLIMVDRPFRVGDEIKLPSGEKVKVIDIGVRRSRFLSEDSAIIIVPNLELSKSKIVNFTYGKEQQSHC